MSKVTHSLALGALIVALFGCVSTPPPKEVFYRFDPPSAEASKGQRKFEKLRVQPLRAQGILSERALQFTRADTLGKIEQYRYHHWAKPPGQLLTEDLMAFLKEANVAGLVVSSDVRTDTPLSIDGELMRLERIIEGNSGQVSVEILLRVQHHSSRELVLQKRYTETDKIDGKSVASVVQAMSRARERIFDQFTNDLRALPRALKK